MANRRSRKERAPRSTTADQILDTILRVPGNKILTVLADAPPLPQPRSHVFDINEQGEIGYDHSHVILLRGLITLGVKNGGSLVLRRFLSTSVQCETPEGLMWLPEKIVCGAALGEGKLIPFSADDMRIAEETDPTTGAPLPHECGVRYADWPQTADNPNV